jgi:hypothetical protein
MLVAVSSVASHHEYGDQRKLAAAPRRHHGFTIEFTPVPSGD